MAREGGHAQDERTVCSHSSHVHQTMPSTCAKSRQTPVAMSSCITLPGANPCLNLAIANELIASRTSCRARPPAQRCSAAVSVQMPQHKFTRWRLGGRAGPRVMQHGYLASRARECASLHALHKQGSHHVRHWVSASAVLHMSQRP